MVRNEIQSLGWITPSRRLSDTLLRAEQLANEQQHRDLTLEHVVLALTDDTDAARVLEANGVDVPRFRDYVARYIAAVDFRWPADNPAPSIPDATLKRIFDVASAAAETSGRNEMDGALIVAAIIGEGTSEAAAMLQQHGLHVDDDEPTSGNTDEQPASISEQRMPSASSEMPHRASGDLTDVHRMLSSPIESHTTSAVQTSTQPAATANTATPMLQRTRPKRRVPQSTALPPKAILSEQAMQGHAQPNGQATLTNGQTQTRDQAQPAMQAHASPPAQQQQRSAPNIRPPQARPPAQHRQTQPQSVPVDAPQNGHAGPLPKTAQQTATAEATPSSANTGNEFAQIDADLLADILPAKMRTGDSEIIEIRVLNSDIDLFTGQPEGRDVAEGDAKLVSRCLSLRLRSSSDDFSIEPRSPEVQWIDAQTVVAGDEATSWRWRITGHRQGQARVQLQASARTVSSFGTVLETSMPEQTASIAVRRGIGARLKNMFLVLTLIGAGCAAGLLARPAYRMIETVLLG